MKDTTEITEPHVPFQKLFVILLNLDDIKIQQILLHTNTLFLISSKTHNYLLHLVIFWNVNSNTNSLTFFSLMGICKFGKT